MLWLRSDDGRLVISSLRKEIDNFADSTIDAMLMGISSKEEDTVSLRTLAVWSA